MLKIFSSFKKTSEPQVFNLQGYGKEAKDKLLELFLEYLKPHWYEPDYVPGLILYLFEHNDATQIVQMTDNATFRQELIRACKEKSMNVDDDFQWKIKNEKPQTGEVKEVRKGIYLCLFKQIKKDEQVQEQIDIQPIFINSAKITVLKGDLHKKTYLLDVKTPKIFNIGRGENPQLKNGMFHKNHIAIKDEELHKSISREHACIFFDSQKGFCLKVYAGGASVSGNGTWLLREGRKPKEFASVNTEPEILKHGDQIRLGTKLKESVVLLFEFVEEKKKPKKKKTKPQKEQISKPDIKPANQFVKENDLGI
jgi:pSer/pThr/pTyr-binding forkhead associated (FHA) protein